MKAQQLAKTGRLSSIRYDNMDIELLTVCYSSLEPQRSVAETTKCLGLAKDRTQTYEVRLAPLRSVHREATAAKSDDKERETKSPQSC